MTATLDLNKITRTGLAKLSPLQLMMYHGKGRMRVAPHLKLIDQWFLQLIYGVGDEHLDILMVLIPPGHAKSTYGSHYAPAWYLGAHPDNQVMLVSYGTDFAGSWGGKARDVFREVGPKVFGVSLDPNRKSEVDWSVRGRAGRMVSQGVDGQVTGKRSHLLISDDLYKNSQDAASEVYRNTLIDFMQDVAYGRLHAGGKMLFLNYRWNLRDIHAWFQERVQASGERIKVLRLPALAEEGDELGRKPGEVLWPDLYPMSDMMRKQGGVGGPSSPTWMAQYMQDPAPAAGTLLMRHWWGFWGPEIPKVDEKWLSVDCTFKDLDTSDFVVVQCWGRQGKDLFYLLDQDKRRMDYTGTVEAIKTMHAKHSPRYIMVEDKANGPAVISALQKEIAGVYAVNPLGGKVSRAQAVSGLVKAGRVFVPRPVDAPWVDEGSESFLAECSAFPRGAHDDQVDSFSQALSMYAGTSRSEVEAQPEEEYAPRRRKWNLLKKKPVVRDPHFGPGLDDARHWEGVQA